MLPKKIRPPSCTRRRVCRNASACSRASSSARRRSCGSMSCPHRKRKRSKLDPQAATVRRPCARSSVAQTHSAPSNSPPPAFFAALDHLEAIRASSVALVSGRDQALGLELLDHASALHSRALNAALDWAQGRCQDPDALQVPSGGGQASD